MQETDEYYYLDEDEQPSFFANDTQVIEYDTIEQNSLIETVREQMKQIQTHENYLEFTILRNQFLK